MSKVVVNSEFLDSKFIFWFYLGLTFLLLLFLLFLFFVFDIFDLRASSYGVVVVHTEPSTHAIPENSYYVPLTQNNTTLTDNLRRSSTAVKPEKTEVRHCYIYGY